MSGESVTVKVPAKVNLHLGVGPLRQDGFHELSTVFHAVDLLDTIRVESSHRWECEVIGRYTDGVPADESNLAVKAGQLLVKRFGLSECARIVIEKQIPVAGGMAGGSADGAGALLALDRLWDLGLTKAELLALAAELGSDVPFSLHGGTALGSGRGERLMPVMTSGTLHWVFAIHQEGLPTATVYRQLDQMRRTWDVPAPTPPGRLIAALRTGDLQEIADNLCNDLEIPARDLLPRLKDTFRVGERGGALAGIVSGSGPTVAFLTEDRAAAIDLRVALTASGVADDAVYASGPTHGAHFSFDINSR
jgi:4-diphosphocytidyl-2-C-methyl-D-erythritol kinase